MITFYQQLAEDEHLYSYIAGLFQKSGWVNPSDFLKAMVANFGYSADPGSYSDFSHHLFPSVLRGLVGTVIDIDDLRPDTLSTLTLLPYYRPFLTAKQQQYLFKESAISVPSHSDRRRSLPQSNGPIFRYCVSCMKAAYGEYGRAVLLRSHQLPCVVVCWQHRESLRQVEIDVDTLSIPDFGVARNKCVQRTSEELLWLATESRTLLHLNRGFTNPPEKIQAMYSFEELGWSINKPPNFVLRENRKSTRRKAITSDIWDAGWSKSVIGAVKNEVASYSDQLRDEFYSPWRDRYGMDRTGPIGAPIEHLMRIRRFAGGVEEFFRLVDEVTPRKIASFFPWADKRHGQGIIQQNIAVTPRVASYLKELSEHFEVSIGTATNIVCDQYRSIAIIVSVTDWESPPAQIEPRSKTVQILMSTENYMFVDRLASCLGKGDFAATFNRLVEFVVSK